jgi:hypothetical protein
MVNRKILKAILTELTVSIPVAGKALGNLCEHTAYTEARKTGQIGGCPVIDVAGKRRVPTAPIRHVLGLDKGGKVA